MYRFAFYEKANHLTYASAGVIPCVRGERADGILASGRNDDSSDAARELD
jgi:hypothetical protein